MADQHRADMMGCAGDSVASTPNMDRLAAEGINFKRAYCQGPLCLPARSSLLCERYVRDHGVFELQSQVPPDMPTFVQGLRDAGYHTCQLGKVHLYPHGGVRKLVANRERLFAYGFGESIETVGKMASRAHDTPYSDYLQAKGVLQQYRDFIGGISHAPSWKPESCPLNLEDYADVWHAVRAAEWIDSYRGDQPFFLWIGFPGPHDPWDAPSEVLEQFRDCEIAMPRSLNRPEIPSAGPLRIFLEKCLQNSDSETMTDEAVIEMRRAYYGSIKVIDLGLGSIVEAIRKKGIVDRTWIVYTSDHGEMMGEHRMLAKSVFYEPAVRVPLIVRPPYKIRGRQVAEPVQLMDLAATFREIAGAAPLKPSAANSLVPSINDEIAPVALDAIVSENYGFAMFLTNRYKLVVYEDTREPVQLFDLLEDAPEDRNLCFDPRFASLVAQLMNDLAHPFLATPPVRPHPTMVDRAIAKDNQRNQRMP
jgi:arylsulfatase